MFLFLFIIIIINTYKELSQNKQFTDSGQSDINLHRPFPQLLSDTAVLA